MNQHADDHRPAAFAPENSTVDPAGSDHPAGDIQPRRPSATGLRVAMLMGMASLAIATAADTTVSMPGFGV